MEPTILLAQSNGQQFPARCSEHPYTVRESQDAMLLTTRKHWHHCSAVGIAILRGKAMLCQGHSYVFGRVD